jgi:hypothetical protein
LETDLNNMTLRDLFAAFAVMGQLANGKGFLMADADVAWNAYKLADAMIETREIENAT